MASASHSIDTYRLHPAVAITVAGMLPLFVGALLSDWAYLRSEQVQWINFAAWLNFGGMVILGLALAATLVSALRHRHHWRAYRIAAALLAATFVTGFIAALVHARDAFATMPGALIMSLIVVVLALAATWATFRGDPR